MAEQVDGGDAGMPRDAAPSTGRRLAELSRVATIITALVAAAMVPELRSDLPLLILLISPFAIGSFLAISDRRRSLLSLPWVVVDCISLAAVAAVHPASWLAVAVVVPVSSLFKVPVVGSRWAAVLVGLTQLSLLASGYLQQPPYWFALWCIGTALFVQLNVGESVLRRVQDAAWREAGGQHRSERRQRFVYDRDGRQLVSLGDEVRDALHIGRLMPGERDLLGAIHAHDRSRFVLWLQRTGAPEGPDARIEVRVAKAAGTRWVRFTITGIDAEQRRLTGVADDVTPEHELAVAESWYAGLLDRLPIGAAVLTDDAARPLRATARWTRIVGDRQLPTAVLEAAAAARINQQSRVVHEQRFGEHVVDVEVVPLDEEYVAVALTEVTDQLRRAQEYLEQAGIDELTGLVGRDRLLQHAADLLAAGRELHVLLLDLDGFKEVNDNLGHLAGDAVLTELGGRLQRLGDLGTFGRLGGDEFAVLLEERPGLDVARVADRIAQRLREPIVLPTGTVRIGVSIGSTHTGHGDTLTDLLRRADLAMYQAKRNDLIHVPYERSVERQSRRRMELIGRLEEALAVGRIRAWFQPIYEARVGRVIGAEALARWEDPDFGVVSPDEFLHLIVSSGRSFSLFRRMLHDATSWAAGMLAHHHSLVVTVNATAGDLADERLISEVRGALAATGLPAQLLVIEVSSQATTVDFPATAAAVAALRNLGVRVALDDVGSGSSALSSLASLPFSELKVDRSVTSGLRAGQEHRHVLQALVNLSRDLGMLATVEGVESVADLAIVTSSGADQVQGFQTGRAVPAEEFAVRYLATPLPGAGDSIDLRSQYAAARRRPGRVRP